MFIREMTLDGKISYWTIRPEANRCITLDQVCKVSSVCGGMLWVHQDRASLLAENCSWKLF